MQFIGIVNDMLCTATPHVNGKIGLEGKVYSHVQDVLVFSLYHTILLWSFNTIPLMESTFGLKEGIH